MDQLTKMLKNAKQTDTSALNLNGLKIQLRFAKQLNDKMLRCLQGERGPHVGQIRKVTHPYHHPSY